MVLTKFRRTVENRFVDCEPRRYLKKTSTRAACLDAARVFCLPSFSSFATGPFVGMSVRLSQLLDPTRIVVDLQATKRTQAIHEVAKRLEGLPQITNFSAFYAELLARERLDTTCIGNEIALPHARTDHATDIVMAAGRSPRGVMFETCNQSVRLLFVLATPKSRAFDYLQVVGLLCRLLKDAATRSALLAAETPEAFLDVIVQAEANPPAVAIGR